MNEDHYRKVKRVWARTSASIASRSGRGENRFPPGFLNQVNEWWRAEWDGQPPSVLDLSGANLTGERIMFSLDNANLRGAILNRAGIIGSAEGADFTGAEMLGSTLYLRCRDAIFRDCNFGAAQLSLNVSQSTDFTGATFFNTWVVLDAEFARYGWKEIEPNREYFLSLLSDTQRSHVSDGPKLPERSACWIATAACGADDEKEVIALRDFRDSFLAHRDYGRSLIRFYERISPPLALRIAASASGRWLTRRMAVKPAARLVTLTRGYWKKQTRTSESDVLKTRCKNGGSGG